MTIEQLRVGDMACQHCVTAIMQAVQAVPGVQKVEINLGDKAVRIERDEEVQISTLISAINAAGYEDVSVLV